MKKELPLPAKAEETGGTMAMETGKKQAKGAIEQSPLTDAAAPLLNVQQETILLSGDELVDPIPPVNIDEPPIVPEIIEETEFSAMEQEAETQQEEIQQDVAEDTATQTISELPPLPGTPQ